MVITDNTEICKLVLGEKAPTNETLCCRKDNCLVKNNSSICPPETNITLAKCHKVNEFDACLRNEYPRLKTVNVSLICEEYKDGVACLSSGNFPFSGKSVEVHEKQREWMISRSLFEDSLNGTYACCNSSNCFRAPYADECKLEDLSVNCPNDIPSYCYRPDSKCEPAETPSSATNQCEDSTQMIIACPDLFRSDKCRYWGLENEQFLLGYQLGACNSRGGVILGDVENFTSSAISTPTIITTSASKSFISNVPPTLPPTIHSDNLWTPAITTAVASSSGFALLVTSGCCYYWYRKLKKRKETDKNQANTNNLQQEEDEFQQQDLVNNTNIFAKQTQTKPTLKSLIGKGGFGEVYYGKWKSQDVAIKKLYVFHDNTSDTGLKLIKKEIDILKNLRNRYIIQYYDTYSDEQELLIIMDYAENGTLTKFINDNKGKDHDWNFNHEFIRQMALGLSFIHHNNIIHRDLKSMNILLSNNYQVKISDFGLSKIISFSHSKDAKGTLRWMAPEVIKEQKYSEKSDVYALGMIIWELVAKCTTPFKNIDDNLLATYITSNKKEIIPSDTPESFCDIIQQCWKRNPDERINLENVLKTIESDKSSPQVIYTIKSHSENQSNQETSDKFLDPKQNNISKPVEFNINELENMLQSSSKKKKEQLQSQIQIPPK